MAKGRKTGGRKAGTPNRTTQDVRDFVDQIFAKIDPAKKIAALLRKPLGEISARVLMRLLEYRYGKPKEHVDVKVNVRHVVEGMRKRSDAPTCDK